MTKQHKYWREKMYGHTKPWYHMSWKDLDRVHWLLISMIAVISIIALIQSVNLSKLSDRYNEVIEANGKFLAKIESLNRSGIEQHQEITKLTNHVAELEAVESRSKDDIKNYILQYYKKTPPSVAEETAKIILEKSEQYDVPFVAIVGVTEVESSFDPYSVSTAGARGLMQVMYTVWGKKFELGNKYALHDIETGVESGVKVLREYLNDTDNNMRKALYKYLGGPNPMRKRFRPTKEQEQYASSVYEAMGRFVMYRSFAAMQDDEEKNGDAQNIDFEIEKQSEPYFHTIQYQGESLSIIARWYTGKTSNWKIIAEKNPEVNPLRLRIDQKILIPDEILSNRTPLSKEFVQKNKPRKKKEKVIDTISPTLNGMPIVKPEL